MPPKLRLSPRGPRKPSARCFSLSGSMSFCRKYSPVTIAAQLPFEELCPKDGDGSSKGSPLDSASMRRRFHASQAARSASRPFSSPSASPSARPFARPSARCFSLSGSTSFCRRYSPVTMTFCVTSVVTTVATAAATPTSATPDMIARTVSTALSSARWAVSYQDSRPVPSRHSMLNRKKVGCLPAR